MQLKPRQELLATFSYTSLTDVVMLLLIFFLLSSSFMAEPGIKVQLPRAETGEQKTEQVLTVTLTHQGKVYLNSAETSLERLQQEVAAALQNAPDRVVQIRADKEVTLQNTVRVIDLAKAAGAVRFMIATETVTAPAR
jgi:biopolymer transport protein ExbD